ncbi:Vta1p LALA0_S11e01486g [Lachancea lanzarotensis]|uniref:LALA0S11e01486g1_1 n=1 Tax=Lachancea lanzarotensis TaxID=1245769 RepID=A0A0C7N8T3_9SACH|nr:uncharacterized protein LALA0_S11e01486g [Lachancea lanzarotensis]CEP64322.1 LALA0S11e01486g1_1 [Lachancea lanzarotensis]
MGIPTSIKRSLRLCGDFEYAMPVIAYYLKLYVVEELLGLPERDEEVIENATKLLNVIEEFKQGPQDEAVQQLLKDQHKAMVYCLNFTLSLYNEQLTKIQTNKFGNDLSRALWCCIDLLTAILVLWGEKEATKDEVAQCQKRIKMCKLFLSRMARGELGVDTGNASSMGASQELSPSQVLQNDAEALDHEDNEDDAMKESENQSLADPEKVESFLASLEQDTDLNEDLFSTADPQLQTSSDNAEKDTTQHNMETDELIRKMRELDAEPASPDDSSEPELQLPQAPTGIDQPPVFLDDDETTSHPEQAVQPTIVSQEPVRFKPNDLKSAWNREDQIAAIQKRARFAISALNYEDLKTAKRELTEALQQLEKLE